MGTLKDLKGQVFGEWTVLERAKNHNGLVFWKCRCSCGTERDVRSASLLNGKSTNCGCIRKKKLSQQRDDLAGQKYNKLLVLNYDVDQKAWKCLCDCGNITFIKRGSAIKNNLIKSCGCLNIQSSQAKIKDLTNQRFGRLIAKKVIQRNPVKWECICDCGNIVQIASTSLVGGLTTSCGCIKSKGEEKIIKILLENNIPFETQKSFDNCIFPNSNRKAHFDFYINNQYLIEYDGIQHFVANTGWSTPETLQKIQTRDAYKNEWCKNNNIPLIRIPYTYFQKISIDDLLLEKSQFLL